MKKFLSVLLAAVMLLAVAGVAMADEATASISFSNMQQGEDVKAYKVIEYTYNSKTEQYEIADWVENVQAWIASTYNYEIPVDKVAETLRDHGDSETAFYEGMRKNAKLTAETNLSALRAGSYICLISGGTTVHQLQLVSLSPKQNSDGSWSLEVKGEKDGELSATDKSSRPQLDKVMKVDGKEPEQNHDTVAIGDKVTFDIYASVPTYPDDAENTTYTITDTMAKGLTNNKDVKVTLMDGTPLSEPNDYTLTYHRDDQGFTIVFNYDSIKSQAISDVSAWDTNAQGEYQGRVDTVANANAITSGVHIQYTATINKDVEIESDSNTNEARLEYADNPYGDSTSGIRDEVKVYTYGLKIDKVDGKDENVHLAGAKFTINKKGITDKLWFVEDETNPGQYTVAKKGTDNAVQEIVTPASGKIEIKGLDVGTYELNETEAPENYNKLMKPEEFTITKNGGTNKYIDEGSASAYNNQTIKNYSGISIPSTGGMGTTIFMVVGIAVMACAVVALMVVLKRQKHGEA